MTGLAVGLLMLVAFGFVALAVFYRSKQRALNALWTATATSFRQQGPMPWPKRCYRCGMEAHSNQQVYLHQQETSPCWRLWAHDSEMEEKQPEKDGKAPVEDWKVYDNATETAREMLISDGGQE